MAGDLPSDFLGVGLIGLDMSHAAEFTRRWPELRLVRRRRFAFVLYPLSGGYSRRPLVPPGLYRPLQVLETVLSPLAPLLAFRCFVVLERR